MQLAKSQFLKIIMQAGISILLVTHATAAWPEAKVYDEYAIKAAYVYNLGKFVSWPQSEESANSEFKICIYGRDPYGEKIDIVSTRKIKGRTITVQRFGYLTADSCSVAFIGQSETYKLEEALLFFSGMPVLTIGENSEFVGKGGMVALVAGRNKVTFEINLAAARAAEFEFSSQLLRIASRLVE